MNVFMKLLRRWEKDVYLKFSYNIMEQGIGTGGIRILLPSSDWDSGWVI